MAHRFLVCPPSRRAIPHPISPWATHIAGGDAPKACRQWERFIEILTCAGDVRIVAVDADVDAPDLTFTGSTALINGNLAILSTARDPARRDQQAIVRATLARAGLATTSLHHVEFRGASDTLFDRVRPCCYAGYHSRADRNSITELTDFIGCRVLPLLLVDDALEFACNAVEVDCALVLHGASRELRSRLNGAGYRVFSTELDEFLGVGGGAKDLALRLDDGPADRSWSPAAGVSSRA